MKTIEFDEVCKDCSGTGLYVGMGEREGFAVVCIKCKGTGKFHFVHKYHEFTDREVSKYIKYVFECNPGIELGISIDTEGLTYDEWLSGKSFDGREVRSQTCPAWWYQTADYDRKPKWSECMILGAFSDCKHFCEKSKCWERFDREGL